MSGQSCAHTVRTTVFTANASPLWLSPVYPKAGRRSIFLDALPPRRLAKQTPDQQIERRDEDDPEHDAAEDLRIQPILQRHPGPGADRHRHAGGQREHQDLTGVEAEVRIARDLHDVADE